MLSRRIRVPLPTFALSEYVLSDTFKASSTALRNLPVVSVIVIAAALSGCALPSSGPSANQVIEQRKTETHINYAMVDVNDAVLSYAAVRPRESLVSHFGAGPRTSELSIAVGDIIGVNLWEAPPGSLFGGNLTASGVQQSSGGSTTIPAQTVSGDGTIAVPYAGRIRVSGRTPSQVERQISSALEGKAVQPQALVTIQRSTANAVTVTGEVASGARISLTGAGERILDVIASSGGIRAGASESIIRLTRNGATARIPFDTLIDNPAENIRVRSGDLITVVREPRTILVLGAAGRNAEIPFEASRISMADALAKAAGLNDNRADAKGVFVLRYEMASVARRFIPAGSSLNNSGEYIPVVYRFNMKNTSTLLAMQRFEMQPRDVIYIANASGAEWQKVMAVFSGISSPALSATSLAINAAAIK
ncbi:polysaccharide export protein (plasmid) [Phyllobacterium sp. 628]|uniref:polysaccharide biosynthesis/export family protein n=1 Tax=Phyllobacterium sp. 628 TaxID=2718938 RepID=UPI0016627807|nr:polysaccharide biosynthesis/export family protein [Phyllobacterium sp. 628]QND50600.1 polysaccharide export protein [Phyllobacterium sp. 628]